MAKKSGKSKRKVMLNSLVLNRLKYFKGVYSSETFRRVVKDLHTFSCWSEVQKELVQIEDNNLRGAVYEEIARAIIKSVKEFTDLYREVYFSKFPSKIKNELILEDGDFGIDAVGETHAGEYHAFQMKHKVNEDDQVYWSADKMGNFYGEAEKAARLIVMSNTMGACRHFRLKAGPRYMNYGQNWLRDLDNKTLTKMGQILEERIERYDKLAKYKFQSELYGTLISIGFNLFKKMRKKYPDWEIELGEPERKVLYKVKGKSVEVPVFDEEDGILILYRFYFTSKKQISDEDFFDILFKHGFEESNTNSYTKDNQSAYSFNFLKFHALGQFVVTIGEMFPLDGDEDELDEAVQAMIVEAEQLDEDLCNLLRDLNRKMSFK